MVDSYFGVSPAWAWTALVLTPPFYYFLHIYLEAIIPDAYGVTETCCFCFRGRTQIREDDSQDGDEIFRTGEDQLKESTIQGDQEAVPIGEEEEFK